MSFSENLLQLKKQAMAQAGPMFAHIDSKIGRAHV